MSIFLTILRYLTIVLAIAGVYGITVVSNTIKAAESPMPDAPPQPPPARPYEEMIAANGIIESFEENVTVATPAPGLVTAVPIKVGQAVKKGDLLFQLDDRDLAAQLLGAEAQIAQADAAVQVAQAQLARAQAMFDRLDKIDDKRAITAEDLQSRKDEVNVARTQVLAAEAQKKTAQAAKSSLELLRERLSVKAPRDGTILQLHIRAGEWAGTDPKSPSLILGRTDRLQARVDIDEQNAVRINKNQKATAHIKGDRDHAIPLTLEYIEPYVVPKTSLTGASTERVDTRVLQVIFSFTPPKDFNVYVGQQVDVFIDDGK
jgi:RND family efflux transporter MFP subunit